MAQDYLKIFNNLPGSVQDAILSEETAQKIKSLCGAVGVNESLISEVAELIGDVMMGISKEDGLSTKLSEAGLTPAQAEALGHNVTAEIIAPLHLTYVSPEASKEEEKPTVVSPFTTSPIQAPQPQTNLRPRFIEPITTSSSPRAEAAPGEIIHPAPFVLHEEKSIEEAQNLYQNFSVQRPTFYKPVFSSEETRFDAYAKPKAATVELGGEEIKRGSPTSLKTSPQQVRVVHYSEFKTDVNPFGGQPTSPIIPISKEITMPNPAIAPTPQTPTAPINSNNVVDLKDLPL